MRKPGPALQIHGIIDKLELGQLATLAKKAQDGAKLSPRDLKLMADLRAKYPQAEKPKRKKHKTTIKKTQDMTNVANQIKLIALSEILQRLKSGGRLAGHEWKLLEDIKAEEREKLTAQQVREKEQVSTEKKLQGAQSELIDIALNVARTSKSGAERLAAVTWLEEQRQQNEPPISPLRLVQAEPEKEKVISISMAV